MIYLILLALIGIGLALGGTYIKNYEGFIAIELPNGTYEMQAWFFLLGLCLAIILLCVIIFILIKIITLPSSIFKHLQGNKEGKANKLLQKSLSELEKGCWKKAEKIAIKGAKTSELTGADTALFLNNAAKAAQHQGAITRRNHYFLEARKLAISTADNLASTLSEIQLRMDVNEYSSALTLINKLKKSHANHLKVIALEIAVQEKMKNYEFVWLNLSRIKKTFIDKIAYGEKQQSIANTIFTDNDSELSLIERVWSELPSVFCTDQKTVLNYASALLRHNQPEKVETLFSKMINSEISDPIIHAYTQLELEPNLKRFKQFKKWLKKENNNPYLNYGTAKQAFQCDLLDEAQRYAEKSIKVMAMPESLALLGKIYELKGEVVSALQAYKCSVGITFDEKEFKDIEMLEAIKNPLLSNVDEERENATESEISEESIDEKLFVKEELENSQNNTTNNKK